MQLRLLHYTVSHCCAQSHIYIWYVIRDLGNSRVEIRNLGPLSDLGKALSAPWKRPEDLGKEPTDLEKEIADLETELADLEKDLTNPEKIQFSHLEKMPRNPLVFGTRP